MACNAETGCIHQLALDLQANKRLNTRLRSAMPVVIFVKKDFVKSLGQVAQLVEQRIENPRVDGSIPPLATRI